MLTISGSLGAAVLLSGCLFIAAAGAGALAIHASGQDAYEGNWEESTEVVWNTAQDVLSEEGVVREVNPEDDEIRGTVNDSNVIITVRPEGDLTYIKVRARKHLAEITPDSETAHDIITKIRRRLDS